MTPSTTYHPPIEEEEEVIISQYTIIVLVDEKTKLCETVNEQAKPWELVYNITGDQSSINSDQFINGNFLPNDIRMMMVSGIQNRTT